MFYVQYGINYIQNQLDTLAIERSTADDYKKSLKAWERTIGDLPLRKLTEDVLRDGLKKMLSQGITPRTVDKRYTVLQMICVDALRHNKIKENPFEWIRRPRVSDTERNYLPQEERDRLKEWLSLSKPSVLSTSVALALYAGLRAEEVCGLQLGDLDLDGGYGWVRRAIGRDGWDTYVKPTKGRDKRDFPICDNLKKSLMPWIQAGQILSYNKNSYLLSFNEEWLHPNKIGKKWRALVEVGDYQGALGKPPTFHDLRHTFATACIAGGMDVKTLQSILGHKNAAMTLDVYASADRNAKLAARDLINSSI